MWNGSEALVQQKLQAVVVSFDNARTSPKIGPPVAHGVHQTNELPLISGERSMTRSDGFAEIGNGAATFMQACPKTVQIFLKTPFLKMFHVILKVFAC